MLIGASLFIMLIIIALNLVLGNDFLAGITQVGIDNEAIVDGVSSTFVVDPQSVIFYIDTSSLIIAGIALLATIIGVALITGISVLGSGLNPQSAKIVIILGGWTGIWIMLSSLAFGLILSIQIFGTVIYVMLTIAFVIGVVQSISGGGD